VFPVRYELNFCIFRINSVFKGLRICCYPISMLIRVSSWCAGCLSKETALVQINGRPVKLALRVFTTGYGLECRGSVLGRGKMCFSSAQ
jgi:hypothetical protein